MISNGNIFTIYESLLQNVMNTFPTIYQNKTKILGKMRKFRIQLQEKVSSIKCAQAIETLFLAELIKVLQ